MQTNLRVHFALVLCGGRIYSDIFRKGGTQKMFEIFEEEQIHQIRIIKFNTLNNSMWGNHSS